MPALLVVLFLSSIVAANVAVSELAPLPVWPGVLAPAGVYLVALTLVLRDLVQRVSGPWTLAGAGVGGVLLSYVLADAQVVSASVVAFAVSFLVDTAIFTLVVRRSRPGRSLATPVFLSGLISMVPDTLIFLHMAGLEQFVLGQLLGKGWGTLIYALALAALGHVQDRRAWAADRPLTPCTDDCCPNCSGKDQRPGTVQSE